MKHLHCIKKKKKIRLLFGDNSAFFCLESHCSASDNSGASQKYTAGFAKAEKLKLRECQDKNGETPFLAGFRATARAGAAFLQQLRPGGRCHSVSLVSTRSLSPTGSACGARSERPRHSAALKIEISSGGFILTARGWEQSQGGRLGYVSFVPGAGRTRLLLFPLRDLRSCSSCPALSPDTAQCPSAALLGHQYL